MSRRDLDLLASLALGCVGDLERSLLDSCPISCREREADLFVSFGYRRSEDFLGLPLSNDLCPRPDLDLKNKKLTRCAVWVISYVSFKKWDQFPFRIPPDSPASHGHSRGTMCPETLFLEFNMYLWNGLSNFQLEGGFWYLYFKGFKSVFHTQNDISLNYKASKIILKKVARRASLPKLKKWPLKFRYQKRPSNQNWVNS